VEITLKATKADVNQIVLHSFDLTIANYSFNGGQEIAFNASDYSEKYNKLTIKIPTNLNGGILQNSTDTILKIKYVGYMKDDMYGFYRSFYYENGKKVWLATTQFQPDHARRAFPCFDVRNINLIFQNLIN
jgi:aminopeptidase N